MYNIPAYSYADEVVSGSSAGRPLSRAASSLISKALISSGLFVLTIWSMSLLSDSSARSDTSLVAGSSVMRADDAILDKSTFRVPAKDATVTCSLLDIYQWEPDCPLAGAKVLSELPRHSHNSLKNMRMTRREAESHGYHPCIYCAEITFWRATHQNAQD